MDDDEDLPPAFRHLLRSRLAPGRVVWIGVRPLRRAAPQAVEQVEAVAGRGLAGDHYASGGRRQVTLIQHEHLAAIASWLGRPQPPEAALLRRNIAVAGINLLALRRRAFRVGGALLEYSGECHPCSRMEEALGPGGYAAVRGHGGILARIVEGGLIRVGDPVQAKD